MHFAATGAHRPALPEDTPVILYPDGPPLPPFAELGILTLPCAEPAVCLQEAERQARLHGGNGLILLPAREAGQGDGLTRFMVIQRDPRLAP